MPTLAWACWPTPSPATCPRQAWAWHPRTASAKQRHTATNMDNAHDNAHDNALDRYARQMQFPPSAPPDKRDCGRAGAGLRLRGLGRRSGEYPRLRRRRRRAHRRSRCRRVDQPPTPGPLRRARRPRRPSQGDRRGGKTRRRIPRSPSSRSSPTSTRETSSGCAREWTCSSTARTISRRGFCSTTRPSIPRSALGVRRLRRRRRADNDHRARSNAVPAVSLARLSPAGKHAHLRNGGHSRPGGRRCRRNRGDRGDQNPQREPRRDFHRPAGRRSLDRPHSADGRKFAPRRGRVPGVQAAGFSWLAGRGASRAAILCGRNAVQLTRPEGGMSLEELAQRLASVGALTRNEYFLRLAVDAYEMTIFADGRAIVAGTTDPAVAAIAVCEVHWRMTLRPGGTADSSPARQCWARSKRRRRDSSGGTDEPVFSLDFIRPYGTFSTILPATFPSTDVLGYFNRPFGTKQPMPTKSPRGLCGARGDSICRAAEEGDSPIFVGRNLGQSPACFCAVTARPR